MIQTSSVIHFYITFSIPYGNQSMHNEKYSRCYFLHYRTTQEASICGLAYYAGCSTDTYQGTVTALNIWLTAECLNIVNLCKHMMYNFLWTASASYHLLSVFQHFQRFVCNLSGPYPILERT